MLPMPRCIFFILALFLIQTRCKTRHNLADRLWEMGTGTSRSQITSGETRLCWTMDSKRVQERRHIDHFPER
ncbi:hypothetical protein FIBSPDRAFT_850087 [Athelia psychrophila]|uniref:Secreted protein n=1 Tax=Athelia psychrophila TaxID=1759441 RepID=A0A166TXI3_9AGAM|nr:hypothetical protein FIBSPDRAFT_850087 [Fibularhizoctonia sp. CBS 109695]